MTVSCYGTLEIVSIIIILKRKWPVNVSKTVQTDNEMLYQSGVD